MHNKIKDPQTRWKRGLLLSLISAVLWGVLPIIMKGTLKDFDPFTATWFRFLGGTCLFGTWLALFRPDTLIPNVKAKRFKLFPVAILCMSGNFSFLTWSLTYQSPSVTQIVLQIGPPFVFLAGAFIFKESVGVIQWIGFALLLPGLALFFNTKLPLIFDGSTHGVGVLLITVSALCFAGYSISQKVLLPEIHPETTLFYGLLGGVIILFPLTQPDQLVEAGMIGIILLLGAILNTFVPFFCYGEALRIWETSRVGAIVAMPPLVTLFATGLVAQLIPNYIEPENLNNWSIVGVFIFVLGCTMGALGKGKKIRDT